MCLYLVFLTSFTSCHSCSTMETKVAFWCYLQENHLFTGVLYHCIRSVPSKNEHIETRHDAPEQEQKPPTRRSGSNLDQNYISIRTYWPIIKTSCWLSDGHLIMCAPTDLAPYYKGTCYLSFSYCVLAFLNTITKCGVSKSISGNSVRNGCFLTPSLKFGKP